MRALYLVLLLSLTIAVAGCASSGGSGTLALHATDAPDDIGDFASLTVTVDTITLAKKDGKSQDHAPASPTFDLTKLTNGNLTTIFNGSVEAGSYTKLTLHVSNASGVLKGTNATVAVKAPSDKLFLNTDFEVKEGQETDFVFDIQVHQEGNGDYIFKPNATGSGPKTQAEIGAQKAAARGKAS